MAMNKKEIIKKALELLEADIPPNQRKQAIHFIDDLCALLPISRATFYNWGLDKLDAITQELINNKIVIKMGLRKQMYQSNHPRDRENLYKILGSQEERDALGGRHVVQVGDGEYNSVKVELTRRQREMFDKIVDRESSNDND